MTTIAELKKIKEKEAKVLDEVRKKEKLMKEIAKMRAEIQGKKEQQEQKTASGMKKAGKRFMDYIYSLRGY